MSSRYNSRREFLRSAGIATSFSMLGGCLRSNGEFSGNISSRPNIILILVDDLGYGDLSCYGATDLRTPNIDRLVSDGIRLDSFYANCPVCSPTRAALLTGRYPDIVGVPGVVRTYLSENFGYLLPEAVMLPEILGRAGYHTACIGKWHLGLVSPNIPNDRGFDHFHGFLGDMMDDYYGHRRHGFNYMRQNYELIDPTGHATDLFTEWGIEYVQQRVKSNKPFFMYLSYNAPHTPIQPPKEWLDKIKERENGIDGKRAKLVALIEHLDDGIGRLIGAIREAGIYENSLIMFVSDNGGQVGIGGSNGELYGSKGQMYEGGLRVPFCAVWPEKIERGLRNSKCVAMTMDLFPTICEVAKASFRHEIDGESILPVLLNQSERLGNRYMFWVRREGGDYGGRAFYAARDGDWKLLQNNAFEPMRLYNLAKDPHEQESLSKEKTIYARLYGELQNHIMRSERVAWQRPIEQGK